MSLDSLSSSSSNESLIDQLPTCTSRRYVKVSYRSQRHTRISSINLFQPLTHHNLNAPKQISSSTKFQISVAVVVLIAILATLQTAEASIGYFENYGWPTYGIVKPFWMTPFSAFPARSISGYSRKHYMHNGRGLNPFERY